MGGMKVLVIGSGGREHAISWTLSKSPSVTEILCVPGNGGTSLEDKCRNVDPSSNPNTQRMSFEDACVAIALDEKCDMAVVGPEEPLANGIADLLWNAGIPVVGPKSQGAALEASKDLAKKFMEKHGVACGASKTFTSEVEARNYVQKQGTPVVVKADGLAAGKGVVVAARESEAIDAIHRFMNQKSLGQAGTKLVLEEYLQGTEISILAAVSVTPQLAREGRATIVPFVTARDHKRLLDGARGPNTGGMGAIAPVPDVTPEQLEAFDKTILQPTLKGMIAEGMDYRGFIFFGIMLTPQGPKLLEYNVRLGDPETQAVLPLMDFDFAEMCRAIAEGTLQDFNFQWKQGFVCAPVAVSGGYPESYKKGMKISLPNKTAEGSKIFIAGATINRRNLLPNQTAKDLITNGGRVLAASAYGSTFQEAWDAAYSMMKQVHFDGIFYRQDIGLPGAAESGNL